MRKNRTYVSFITESLSDTPTYRVVQLGIYPKTMVMELKQNAEKSSLWRRICKLIDEQYPNDKLLEINANGAVNAHVCGVYIPKANTLPTLNLSGSRSVFS